MRILVFSDLHLELHPRWSLRRRWPQYDVAVCAGDLSGSIALSVAYLATHPVLGSKPAILVAGNHEYWDDEMSQAEEAGRWAAKGTNVRFLQGEAAEIDGLTFVGATLWTDYALLGEPAWHARRAAQAMEDHNRIAVRTTSGDKRAFMPGDAVDLHRAQLSAIEAHLAKARGKTVVVTHHLPSRRSIDASLSDDFTELDLRDLYV